jgi:hypothetical protein
VNLARVLDQFPPDEPVYAVLDCARDKRLRSAIFDARLARFCLYRGTLTPELEDAAPWLVSLPRAHPSTARLFARIWGGSCAIFFSSALPNKELRRHLRRFLLAQNQRGQVLLFRYYDPRVLRVYLPTLTAPEAKQFFGGISAFVTEETDPERFQTFRRNSGT